MIFNCFTFLIINILVFVISFCINLQVKSDPGYDPLSNYAAYDFPQFTFTPLTFTQAQLKLRSELQATTKQIEKLNAKISDLIRKGASYKGKAEIDLQLQALDLKVKKLLEKEKEQTKSVEDQYVMVTNELARLENQMFNLKKTAQLGAQYQVQEQQDFLNYNIREYKELLKILYPQKARDEGGLKNNF